MIDKIIIDADLCIKLGGSENFRFLYDILPIISKEIYMHSHAYSEVKMPQSAVNQLNLLIKESKVKIVNENELDEKDRVIFDLSYAKLKKVMIDPKRPNKNRGEVCSLAYAKATGIPVFATDEMNLQPIIDAKLNTGINNITCLRIVDIIQKARKGEIDISRKTCNALWIIAGKRKEIFDKTIWSVKEKDYGQIQW